MCIIGDTREQVRCSRSTQSLSLGSKDAAAKPDVDDRWQRADSVWSHRHGAFDHARLLDESHADSDRRHRVERWRDSIRRGTHAIRKRRRPQAVGPRRHADAGVVADHRPDLLRPDDTEPGFCHSGIDSARVRRLRLPQSAHTARRRHHRDRTDSENPHRSISVAVGAALGSRSRRPRGRHHPRHVCEPWHSHNRSWPMLQYSSARCRAWRAQSDSVFSRSSSANAVAQIASTSSVPVIPSSSHAP